MHAVIVGASGVVGRALMAQLAQDARFETVTAVSRRPLHDAPVPVRVVDFADATQLREALAGDVLFCALGTTTRAAGKQGLAAVDRDLVVRCAQAALAAGAQTLVVVSSLGASAKAWSHYARVKGQMEAAVSGLGFGAVHIVRPSLLMGPRAERRFAETAGKLAMRGIGPVLPARWRGIDPSAVAEAMRELAINGAAGAWVHHLPLRGAGVKAPGRVNRL